jgi:hypothetical protein
MLKNQYFCNMFEHFWKMLEHNSDEWAGGIVAELLYGFRKMDKHTNFQSTKAHLNDVFYFSNSIFNDC